MPVFLVVFWDFHSKIKGPYTCRPVYLPQFYCSQFIFSTHKTVNKMASIQFEGASSDAKLTAEAWPAGLTAVGFHGHLPLNLRLLDGISPALHTLLIAESTLPPPPWPLLADTLAVRDG